MKQLLIFLLYGILLSSVQTQSQSQWVADFGSGFGIPVPILKLSGVKETDHVNNASHKTSQSTSAKILGAGASVDQKQLGNTNKPEVENLLANPNEIPPPPLATRRDQGPFELINSRPPPVSATDTVRERKLQQLQFIMGNDVPRSKLEALLDVFGSDSASSQSQPTRPPPPLRNSAIFPARERQERPSSNGWPSTPPPPRDARGTFRRQESRVDPFLSSDTMPSAIPPPPGSANRGQRSSRGFIREFTSPTPSPPSFDGPPQGRVDMDARRQEMIERRLQQEQAKNSQESNLQMMRTLRALTRQRARTPAAEAPEQPEPGSMNPLLMALFSGMGGGGEAGSTGLGGGLGSLLGGGGDLASLMALQRGGSASGAGESPMGGLGGGMSGLLGSMGGGMGGLANMLGLGMGGLGGTSATDTTDGLGKSNTNASIAPIIPAPPLSISTATHFGTWLAQDQLHDHPVKPTTLPVQAITSKVSNEMAVVKTGQISQSRLAKTTVVPKPMFVNVADHHQPNQHAHSVQTHIDPVMFLDINNQIHDLHVPNSSSLGPDVRKNMIEQPSNELLPTLLDSTMNQGNKKNLTLQELLSTTMPSSMIIGTRRKDIRIPARQNITGENTITTLELMPRKEINISSSHLSGLSGMIPKTPNAGFGGHLGTHSQNSFGSMQNNLKTTVSPPAPPNAAMDIHGQIHDHPIGPELIGHARGHSGHSDHAAGHGQQNGNGKLAGRDNQSGGNANTNNPSSSTGVPSDLAALLQMQMGARASGLSNNGIGMGGLPSLSHMISMTGRGVGSGGTGGFGNTGAVTTSLEMMSLVPGLTLDHMSDLIGSYRGPIPREILVQAQALSRAGQSGDQIADVLGDVMQQWVRQQGLATNTGFSAGSTGLV
ncbi:hypothetical protein CHS0354_019866 [Potamilus streckersoni]|uniref:Uncharacterized protein n=1 Tax=Potamilus streckersoni TaxID=2493646 RepID=A0AAE0W309_9BIVA|nr:hypothetical protein CHS0354_019866 [Potamilus streckersoni]